MIQSIISSISALIAVTAVSVAVWHVRVSTRAAEKSNAMYIVSQIFGEWRSISFHKHRTYLLSHSRRKPPVSNFESLPRAWRESAYTVCYFCDYVGMLAAYDIIKEDLIIGVMCTQLMQVWNVMEPYIKAERKYRAETFPSDTPPGFLPYYENLVERIRELGGSKAAAHIQDPLKLRTRSDNLCGSGVRGKLVRFALGVAWRFSQRRAGSSFSALLWPRVSCGLARG